MPEQHKTNAAEESAALSFVCLYSLYAAIMLLNSSAVVGGV